MNLGKFRRYQEQQAGKMQAQQPQVTDRRQFILDRQLEAEKLTDTDDASFGDVTIAGTLTLGTPAGGPFIQTYATADTTLAAWTPDTESVAYTGIATGVGGTPYAQLTDVNALRVAYENLRVAHAELAQFVNALVDVLQARGDIT